MADENASSSSVTETTGSLSGMSPTTTLRVCIYMYYMIMRVIEECCSCEMIIGWLLFQSHHHHGRREKNETLCTYHRTQYVRSHPLVHTVQYGFYVQYA